MTPHVRLVGFVVALGFGAALFAASVPQPVVSGMPLVHTPAQSILLDEDEGYPIENETVVARCSRCHEQDDQGRMTRISFERKTPEGWQTSVRRMMALNSVRLEPEEAREVVRYLSNRHGIAPEELEPGRFEVERRMIEYDYEGDDDVENTCIQCHSMGRVITQRRTREEWELLLATHRGLYPLVDFQAFRTTGGDEDSRHPMDVAVDHLSEAFPLQTPEWSAWSASMRTPRLAGTWALAGFEPGKGQVFGTVEISPGDAPDEFRTSASYTYAETGGQVTRSGQSIVYTGYQWRGRSNAGRPDELREVMGVERGWQEMTGRWFAGAYDEFGIDVRLTRIGEGPALAGVHPPALEAGAPAMDVTLYGANLPAGADASAFDFGPGVSVESVRNASESAITLRVAVADGAALGGRDLFVGGVSLQTAIRVHDGVDRIEVSPRAGMARVGGANFPKGFQAFDAIGWDDGPDGEPNTADDLDLGRVSVTWSMEEYTATFDDDDIDYVGTLGSDGIFNPAVDGPNGDRIGSRNNVGDVWVVATYAGSGAGPDDLLRARANLIVTVPLYLRFDPWQQTPTRLVP